MQQVSAASRAWRVSRSAKRHLFGCELQVLVVAAEEFAEAFDDEFVILAHGDAGDGDTSDYAGAGDAQRK